MNTVGLVVVSLVVIYISYRIRRWRYIKCTNGVLPPGFMGFPFIGETLSLIIPSYSLDLHPFIKKRIQRYGPIFKTSIAGRPVVVSTDPEFNSHIFRNEENLVEMYYLDTFSKIFVQEGESRTTAVGNIHKYIRNIFLNHFGSERLKKNLIIEIEQVVNKTLSSWATQTSVEVKQAASTLLLNFSAKQMIGYDDEKSPESLSKAYANIITGLMSFPLKIPGTAYHQCLKDQKKIFSMVRGMLKKRRELPEKKKGDFLDNISKDMAKENFLSEDFVVQVIFGGLFATFESVSAVIALAFKLLSDHPAVVEELIAEHETILKSREDPNSSITWDEYKSMTFTLQVINETLRLGNVSPGLLRRALQNIPFKGFTIPKGWTIMLVTSALQLNPNTFESPLEFNPRRWKDLDSLFVSKNFVPFGGGIRQCAGAEYSRVFIATFFHVLFTKYRWKHIETGNISRNPVLGFGKGIHIKFFEK